MPKFTCIMVMLLIIVCCVTAYAEYENMTEIVLDSSVGVNYDNIPYDNKMLEKITLPSDISLEQLEDFMDSLSAGDDLEIFDYWWSWDDEEADEEPFHTDKVPGRQLSHIHIAKDHPFLYDVDGVVFDRTTDTLVAFPPARKGAYTVPDGTKTIGSNAFRGAYELEYVVLPNTLTRLEDGAFGGCVSLHSLRLPFSLSYIGEYAFGNCHSLINVVLPSEVTVQAGAFDYCVNLAAVYALDADIKIDADAFNKCKPKLVFYAPKNSDAYLAAALNGQLWAEPNQTPMLLENPRLIYHDPAIVLKADAQGKFAFGETVEIMAIEDEQALVMLNGQEGYIPLDYLHRTRLDAVNERLLRVDMKYKTKLYTTPNVNGDYLDWENIANASFKLIETFGTWYVVEKDGEPYYLRAVDGKPYGLMLDDGLNLYGAKGIVSCEGVANMYKEPSEESECIGKYFAGRQVKLLAQRAQDGFYHVEIGGETGYMHETEIEEIRAVWFYYAD